MSVSTTAAAPQGAQDETSPFASRPLHLSGRAILLAVDGSDGSMGSIRLALALAHARHAAIHVIQAVDPAAGLDDPPDARADVQREAAVRDVIHDAVSQHVDWRIRVVKGAPASVILSEARRIRARLIIVGLRKHGRLHRALNDETALNVMQQATCPVLGVIPTMTRLPKRVLAAVDFGEASLLAARAARAIVADDGFLVLAYVAPLNAFLPDDGELVIHELGVQACFARTAANLRREDITFDHVVLHRELPRSPTEMILEYADATNADLIAAGSVRRGRVDRWMMGSVSTDLVRDGSRSVLIVPPQA